MAKGKKDFKALATSLVKEVEELEKNLQELKENIDLLQNGEVWDGMNALNTNKALSGHYDHNMVLLENVKKCSEYINSVANE